MPCGDVGDVLLGVCDEDAAAEVLSSSGARLPFLDLAPMRLFFNLNFSIQLELRVEWLSGLVVVAENARALSRIISSLSGRPLRSCDALLVTPPC